MPFCYRSRLLLLLCLLTFLAWDVLGAFPHTRSKCHKYQNLSKGEREIPRGLLISIPPFWKRNWKGKLLHFILPPAFLLPKRKKSIGAETEKKNATMFAYSIPKKQRHFWDSESRRGDVHKKKTTKLKLSPCPFSQFGAETQATATGNSLFAPGRIPSAATPWQTGPCVGLRAGAHCPP